MASVAKASNRSWWVQLTSDGHKPYLDAIEGAFGGDIDYAMLVKIYGAAKDSAATAPQSVLAQRSFASKATPIPSTSARHMWSGKI